MVKTLNKKFQDKFIDIFTFDSIRLLKLLEFSQYGILGFTLGFLLGDFMNDYLLVEYKESNYVDETYKRKVYNKNPKLWLHIFWDVSMIVIATYYIKKLSDLFPFLFSFINKKYIVGRKGEDIIGFTLGLGFIYTRILNNFVQKMNLLMGKLSNVKGEVK